MDNLRMTKINKALADETRIKILKLLAQGQNCGCDLIGSLNITQPTLSHHLKVLVQTGIISGVKTQNKIHYTVHLNVIEEAHALLIGHLKEMPNC
ncbi:ArsR/SmtB family transcription factor [Liberiplasma polymorphum]|uniref:ArsR/SmtB family transcription factor n=1 Tax=Liberiplasma polymorphum TaxID=3374570 RepID=UPI0037739D6E